jgi:hypothetical protein
MKRALIALIVTAFSGIGCESLPRLWERPKPPPTPTVAKVEKPPVVTVEQVNETNARQIAQSLLDEMDRDAQGESPAASDQAAKPVVK